MPSEVLVAVQSSPEFSTGYGERQFAASGGHEGRFSGDGAREAGRFVLAGDLRECCEDRRLCHDATVARRHLLELAERGDETERRPHADGVAIDGVHVEGAIDGGDGRGS